MSLIPFVDVLSKIVDQVLPDADKKLEVKLQLAKIADAEAARENQLLIAQTEVNKAEAGHSSIFVAGWRPAIGWGCGIALVYNTLLAPMFHLGVADLPFLQTILMGMLGLSVSRTVEKMTGNGTMVLPLPKKNEHILQAPKQEKKKPLGGLWPF